MRFAEATSVRVDPDDNQRYHAEIHDGWDIRGNANGGYMIALAARAMLDASGRRDIATLTAHYLSPGPPTPVTIDTNIVKAGKSFSTVTAQMAGDRPILQLLGSFSETESGVTLLADAEPPELPSPEDCVTAVGPASGEDWPPALMNQIDLRIHPDDALSEEGQGSGNALIRGYFRLMDDESISQLGLLLCSDAFQPTIFNTEIPVAWVPTLELTVQFRAQPAPGWIRAKLSTRSIGDGLLEEDGEFWDSTGRLVALSRQLALVPRT